MSRIRVAAIVLVVLTGLWLTSYSYAVTQIRVQLFLRPGDRFIYAIPVQPTQNATEWLETENGHIQEGEYQGELVEPMDEVVRTAIQRTYYFVLVEGDIPVKHCDVYSYAGGHYLFFSGASTMYVDAIHPDMLRTQSLTTVALIVLGIPLFAVCWPSLGIMKYKQRKQQQPAV